MARYTKTEIETMVASMTPEYIQASVEEYVAELLLVTYKQSVGKIDANFIKIKNALNSLTGAASLGMMIKPVDPSVDPTDRNGGGALQENDFYFNTTEVAFKWYNKATDDWYSISMLPAFQHILDAYKADTLDKDYLSVFDSLDLKDILDSDLTAEELATISNRWMSGETARQFAAEMFKQMEENVVEAIDSVKYIEEKVGKDRNGNPVIEKFIEFTDRKNHLLVGKFPAEKNLNTVQTTKQIDLRPYLHQPTSSIEFVILPEGGNITLSFPQSAYNSPAGVSPASINKPIAIKFANTVSTADDSAKLETIAKWNPGTSKFDKFIRISGTADMWITEAIVGGGTQTTLESHVLGSGAVVEINYDELLRETGTDDGVLFVINATNEILPNEELVKTNIKASAQISQDRYIAALLDYKYHIDVNLKGEESEIQNVWNAISDSDVKVRIKYETIKMLGYYAEINGKQFKYKEVPITTNGNTLTAGTFSVPGTPVVPVLDVWSRIKNKNNSYEITLDKIGDVLEYEFAGGYKLKIKATDNLGKVKFVYDARTNKIFVFGTKATLTDYVKGVETHTDASFIQLDISRDTIGTTAGNAAFRFILASTPIVGNEISRIDLNTSDNKKIEVHSGIFRYLHLEALKERSYHYPVVSAAFTGVAGQYIDTDAINKLKIGEQILIDWTTNELKRVQDQLSDNSLILMVNMTGVSGAPTETLFEQIVSEPYTNAPDRAGYSKAREWAYFKDMIDDNYVVLEKSQDFDGKTVWITNSWKAKPPKPLFNKMVTKDYNNWDEMVADKDNLISVTAYAINKIDYYGAALLKDHVISLDSYIDRGWGLQGATDMTNGQEYKVVVNGSVRLYKDGVEVAHADPIAFNKFKWVGQVWQSNTYDKIQDAQLTGADFGSGDPDRILGLNASGKIDVRKEFNQSKADLLYASKTVDYSQLPSPITELSTGGEDYLVVFKKPEAASTPVGVNNKIWLSHQSNPNGSDKMGYGVHSNAIVKPNGDAYTWSEIVTNVLKDELMIIKHLADGNWELIGWDANPNKRTVPFYGEYASEVVLNADKAVKVPSLNDLAYTEAEDKWWHFDGTNWVHHIDSGGTGGTAGLTGIHLETVKVSIGTNAGNSNQSEHTIAIGPNAGKDNQGINSVAVGSSTGRTDQGARATAVGSGAGATSQGDQTVAVGYNAGFATQGINSVAVGFSSGASQQGHDSVAIGHNAANTIQGNEAVAVGAGAGHSNQKTGATAVGSGAAYVLQGTSATAIGKNAGNSNQGDYAVAVGSGAGSYHQPAKSVVISAANTAQTPSAENEILIVAGTTTLKIDATGIYLNGVKVVNTSGAT